MHGEIWGGQGSAADKPLQLIRNAEELDRPCDVKQLMAVY